VTWGDLFCVVEAGHSTSVVTAGADGPAVAPSLGLRALTAPPSPRALGPGRRLVRGQRLLWRAVPHAGFPRAATVFAGATGSCGAQDRRAFWGIVAAHTRQREEIVRDALREVRTSPGRRPSCLGTSVGPRASPTPMPIASPSCGRASFRDSATSRTSSTDRLPADRAEILLPRRRPPRGDRRWRGWYRGHA